MEETNEQNVLEDENYDTENEQTDLGSDSIPKHQTSAKLGKSLRGKNGHRWCTSVANRSKLISKRNIVCRRCTETSDAIVC